MDGARKKSPAAERTDLFYKESFVYIVCSKKSELNFPREIKNTYFPFSNLPPIILPTA